MNVIQMNNDLVNKPKHYNNHPSGIECKEIAMFLPAPLANAVKYIWRYEDKENPQQDLEKCLWYLKETLNNMSSNFIYESLKLAKLYIDPEKFRFYFAKENNQKRWDFMKCIHSCVCYQDMEEIKTCIKIVEILIKEERQKK